MTTTAGTKPHPIYLAGRWVESDDLLEVSNPAHPDEPAGATFHATEAQYEEAVEAAVAAFEVTRTLPAYERGAILRNISAGIKARREELGRLIALEAGKPIRDSLVEVDRATLTFRLGAEEAERMVGETIPLDLMPASKGRIGITRRFPIGPIAGDQPVQLPAEPRRPQGRAGDRVGQPDRPQAAVQGPAHDADGRRDHRGGRRAGGQRQHPADEPRAGRPDGQRRALQAADVHRQPVGRLADEGARRQEEGRARAGRQRRRDRRQDRRPRLGGQADARRGVHLRRPGLHQRPADVRPRGHLGRVHGPLRRGRAGRSRWATRSIPQTEIGPDGRRRRGVADPALGRRGRRAGRQAPARRQGRRHVLPADDPDRRPGRPPRSARTRPSRRSSSRSRSATSATRSAR